ncbi:Transcriptional regulator/sugar kinase [Frankia canadensis]|uniref:Transcriptional regulator/sugar kinase n=1 Tax=Frankia canadensis TaxID=1836972 RepID=A0A2I2KRZ9_9ACTN|nr:ROK family transcriptional regulator [Frankia canadensis]SNQ48443.1 Transcriptional regulator/sugar kinase [Frankia canadensis]SOU55733.1 Transcriptional regulator/sugar kinase [Frankia canadensis]
MSVPHSTSIARGPSVPSRPPGAPSTPGSSGRDGTSPAAAILRAVLDHGPVARTAIGRATGLSPAAVSRQTAGLISLGLLRELPASSLAPRAGRPHTPLDVDTRHHVACGVHIAVPYVTFGLVDLRGHVVAQERLPRSGDARAVLDMIGRRLPGFLARHARGNQVLGLGVVTGGRVDPRRGRVIEHEPLDWHDVPVRELLAPATGLRVHVDGHARALAQAEILFGDPRARRSLLQLFVGNVVDAAFATDGIVHVGPHAAAGGIAHLRLADSTQACECGRAGCAQAALSERTLLRRALDEGIITVPDIQTLAAVAAAGDRRAVALFRERVRAVGRLVAQLVDVMDPELVVLTEAAVMLLPELRDDLHAEIAAHSRVHAAPARAVLPSSFGPDVLAVAAAATVLHAVHRSPQSVDADRRRTPAADRAAHPREQLVPTGRQTLTTWDRMVDD